MDAIVSAIASLLGVALGVGLTTFGGRRSSIRADFRTAKSAVTYAHAAHRLYRSDGIDGVRDAEMSRRLLETMATERNAALLAARRALSALAPYSRVFEGFAVDIAKINQVDVLNAIVEAIDREESNALRPRFRLAVRR